MQDTIFKEPGKQGQAHKGAEDMEIMLKARKGIHDLNKVVLFVWVYACFPFVSICLHLLKYSLYVK